MGRKRPRRISAEDRDRLWWEKTFSEREEIFRDTFGVTEPPGFVHSFAWDDFSDMIPGGCSLTFPPREHRDHWLHLTHGLTQPLEKSGSNASAPSGFGSEFALLTRERCDWPIDALYWIMTYCKQSERKLDLGRRLPFWFQVGADQKLLPTIGGVPDLPHGNTRTLMFWLYQGSPQRFMTSTGYFWILVGTTITGDEWQMAKDTSSLHLLLLLNKAGIGQRSEIDRPTILDDPKSRADWQTIEQLSIEDAESQLQGFESTK